MLKRIVIAVVTFVAFGIGSALIIPLFHPKDAQAAGEFLFPFGLAAGIAAFFIAKPKIKAGELAQLTTTIGGQKTKQRAMRVSPNVKKWLIVSAVVATVALIWWLSDNYIEPPVKAAISIRAEKITIQNMNRIDWKDPEFVLDDGAKLKPMGVWHPSEQRTFQLSEFRNPSTGLPHDPHAKKGFEMMVFMSGFTTTVLYNWDL